MSEYVLPALPYDPGALEPHISGKVMEVHHGGHHAAYVKSANAIVQELHEERDRGDFKRIAALEKALAFNLSGHVLHSIFWRNLSPRGGGQPDGELAQALQRDFGGFDRFRRQMTAVAGSVMGSGWAALVWEPVGRRLLVVQIHDHQSNIGQGNLPIMVLDAWEHAYYLQYQNRKQEFFEAVWNVWCWRDIAERFAAVRKADLRVEGAAR